MKKKKQNSLRMGKWMALALNKEREEMRRGHVEANGVPLGSEREQTPWACLGNLCWLP